jgi:hypothetical protein
MIEFRHFSLAAEVLGNEQYRFVWDEWFVVTRDDLDDLDAAETDMEELRAAVERFQVNDGLQAWLNKVWGMQKEQQWTPARRRRLAEEALQALRTYQARWGQLVAEVGSPTLWLKLPIPLIEPWKPHGDEPRRCADRDVQLQRPLSLLVRSPGAHDDGQGLVRQRAPVPHRER